MCEPVVEIANLAASVVLLRPFHYLIHNQDRLRDHLARLEKRYHNYDPNVSDPQSSHPVPDDGNASFSAPDEQKPQAMDA